MSDWWPDYNTRIVVSGVTLLGLAAGVVGVFTLLRRRALLGDAVAHATLPGIAIAFLMGSGTKSHAALLLGAIVTGTLGMLAVMGLSRVTKLKQDTALGIVLSVFFGVGAALLGIVQDAYGNAAGLESYIFGKTASMNMTDIKLIAVVGILSLTFCLAFFKEITLLCFDEDYASARGYPSSWMDIALMIVVIAVTIVGLQAVGMILMIAMLVIPAAAARFWTDRIAAMLIISGAIGSLSGSIGAIASASVPMLPSGAIIVLIGSFAFGVSLFIGQRRGWLPRWLRRRSVQRTVSRQHLLRAMFEAQEGKPDDLVTADELLRIRSWSSRELSRILSREADEGWVRRQFGEKYQLTRRGFVEAKELTRQHRLWELYLITHADVAAARVDRQADRIEHVLAPEVVAELRTILENESSPVPSSPHEIEGRHLPAGSPEGELDSAEMRAGDAQNSFADGAKREGDQK